MTRNPRLHQVPVPDRPLVRVEGMRGKFRLHAFESNRFTGAAWAVVWGPVTNPGQFHHVRTGRVTL